MRRWIERGGMTGGEQEEEEEVPPVPSAARPVIIGIVTAGRARHARAAFKAMTLLSIVELATDPAGCLSVCLSWPQASLENLRDQLLDERSHQIKRLEECLRTGLALEGEGTFEWLCCHAG